ncbi:hypothetical protein CBR_g17056 [Chara braunii]|uniref:STAS domain-containing protein n=1 Tax=Chara braunii TaxID=69332 RepID=A0A388KUH5_CHABU|nr:hypothetical protein CBR_g17056 [Chara braunii]|eukprot:GBG73715.1 hypothetical protein CBR_g17056 [Chara braunii]
MADEHHLVYQEDGLDSPLLKNHLTHLKVSKNYWNLDWTAGCPGEDKDKDKDKDRLSADSRLGCLNVRGDAESSSSYYNNVCSRTYAELPFDVFGDYRGKSASESAQIFVNKTFPCVKWLRKYNLSRDLWSDVTAGLSVGFMAIPEGMAYARIAGLRTIYGLYASFVPIFAYAIFGSSKHLAVGPVALVSLLVAESLKGMVPEPARNEGGSGDGGGGGGGGGDGAGRGGEDYEMEYARLAVLLALLVGVVQASAGILRLGTLVRFLSHSVVSGFASGAAIIIALSQAKNILGCNLPKSSQVHIILFNIWNNIHMAHIPTLLTGVSVLLFLLFTKLIQNLHKSLRFLRIVAPLVVTIGGTLFIRFTNNCYGMKTVGDLPEGLPPFSIDYEWKDVQQLFLPAVVVAGVGFMESIAIAKALAGKNGYEISASHELVGIGFANIVGSMFGAYPVAGSVSRSAVSDDTGARTGLAGMVTGLLVLVSLLFLTTLFEDLPFCVLAAIVISAVLKLIDFSEILYLYRVNRRDCIVWLLAFVGVVFFSVEVGVAVAVVISLGFILHETANPHTAVLGRLPGTTVYRNVEQYPDAKCNRGIVIVRIDAPIFFANIPFLKDCLQRYELHAVTALRKTQHSAGQSDPSVRDTQTSWDMESCLPEDEQVHLRAMAALHKKQHSAGQSDPSIRETQTSWDMESCLPANEQVRYVVLEMTPVTMIDSDGCKALTELYHQYKVRGVTLAICNPNRAVMSAFFRAKLTSLIGRQWFFVHAHEAVLACLEDKRSRFGCSGTQKRELGEEENQLPRPDASDPAKEGYQRLLPGPPPVSSGSNAERDSPRLSATKVRLPLPSIKTHMKGPAITPTIFLSASEVFQSPHVFQQEVGVADDLSEERVKDHPQPPQVTYCPFCSARQVHPAAASDRQEETGSDRDHGGSDQGVLDPYRVRLS